MFGSEDGGAQGQLSMNIRGGSDRMVSTILDFAAELKVRAFDLQSGDWLMQDSGAGSFARWAAYRDHVVGEAGNPS